MRNAMWQYKMWGLCNPLDFVPVDGNDFPNEHVRDWNRQCI